MVMEKHVVNMTWRHKSQRCALHCVTDLRPRELSSKVVCSTGRAQEEDVYGKRKQGGSTGGDHFNSCGLLDRPFEAPLEKASNPDLALRRREARDKLLWPAWS